MEHLENAIRYVRDNHRWSDACEEYALETINVMRCPIDFASEEIAGEIADLLDEYGDNNDLPQDWWRELVDVDEVFFKL